MALDAFREDLGKALFDEKTLEEYLKILSEIEKDGATVTFAYRYSPRSEGFPVRYCRVEVGKSPPKELELEFSIPEEICRIDILKKAGYLNIRERIGSFGGSAILKYEISEKGRNLLANHQDVIIAQ